MAQGEDEDRVRLRAYKLWLEEGQPEGRADVHWDQARELVAIEESTQDTLLPNPIHEYEQNPTTEPIEPRVAIDNMGEFPGLADQGDDSYRLNDQSENETSSTRSPNKS